MQNSGGLDRLLAGCEELELRFFNDGAVIRCWLVGTKKIVLSIGRIEEVVLRRVGRYGVWFLVFDTKLQSMIVRVARGKC